MVQYIRHRNIPLPREGKHLKVASWKTHESTIGAIKEYRTQAGEGMPIAIRDNYILLDQFSWSLNN